MKKAPIGIVITLNHIRFVSMKEEVLQVLIDHGTLIEPDAVNFILSQKDPKAFIKEFLEGRAALPLVLSLKDFRTTESVLSYETESQSAEKNGDESIGEEEKPDGERRKFEETGGLDARPESQTTLPEPEIIKPEVQKPVKSPPESKDIETVRESGVVVISDITGNSTCEANIDNFARYFKDRYLTLRRIIRKWQRMRSSITIEKAMKKEGEVRIIGMVNEVAQTKNGHTTMHVEDDTGKIFVLIPKGNPLQSMSIINDEVIGIIGQVKKRKDGYRSNEDPIMLLPDEIIKPDIPVNQSPNRADNDVEVLFLSDIHIGSKHFLSEEWARFSAWLKDSDEASKVKYMVVTGDLVDGIGIYPNQKNELDIPDIMEQYATIGRMLEDLPDHIEIILQPGNHDAVRSAEPQPALDHEIQTLFNGSGNLRFVGNPCYFSIEGVNVLSYHGKSMDDFIMDVPKLSYDEPIEVMKEMLKLRHLAPIYGGKNHIAPEDKDYLIINPVPDIFVTGHVHGTDVDTYRGVMMINASAWQSQTPFQLMHNFNPDPAKAICVNLMTGKCKVLDFSS